MCPNATSENTPDNKVPGANMGPIWGRQDPGGPHVGPRTLLSETHNKTAHSQRIVYLPQPDQ